MLTHPWNCTNLSNVIQTWTQRDTVTAKWLRDEHIADTHTCANVTSSSCGSKGPVAAVCKWVNNMLGHTKASGCKTQHTDEERTKRPCLLKAYCGLGGIVHRGLTSRLHSLKMVVYFLQNKKRHIWRKFEMLQWFWTSQKSISIPLWDILVQTSCDLFSDLYPGLTLVDRPHIPNPNIFSPGGVVLLWFFWSLFFPVYYWGLFNLNVSLLVYSINKWTTQKHSEHTHSFTWHQVSILV